MRTALRTDMVSRFTFRAHYSLMVNHSAHIGDLFHEIHFALFILLIGKMNHLLAEQITVFGYQSHRNHSKL